MEGDGRGVERIRGRGVSVAFRPSTRASKRPVTQLVFVARGAFRQVDAVRVCSSGLPSGAGIPRQDVPDGTVWLSFPLTGWGWLRVLSHLVEQQGRKATQPSSWRWRCASPPWREPSWSSSPWCLALQAAPRNARIGCVRLGRWPMGGGIDTPLASRCLVSGGTGLHPQEAVRRWKIATPVQAPRIWVPVGSGLRSSPVPRASIRLRLAPRREPPRVALTSRRHRRGLELISAEDNRPT